jgi:hypothetical protein
MGKEYIFSGDIGTGLISDSVALVLFELAQKWLG